MIALGPMKKLALHMQIFIGLAIGFVAGTMCNIFFPDTAGLQWVITHLANPIGQIFLRMIFMVVIPLIIAALALGASELGDVSRVGRIGVKTLLLTLLLSGIAVVIGIGMVNLFQPGVGLPPDGYDKLAKLIASQGGALQAGMQQAKPFSQMLIDFIPRNPFADMVGAFDSTYRGGGLIAIMVFALLIGLGMSAVGAERAAPLKAFFESVFSVMLKIIGFAMRLAPLGVAGLVFSVTATIGLDVVALLGKYLFVVLFALLIQQVVIYSLAVRILARRNPWQFFRDIREVIITAFSTSSSNATLPTSLRVAQDELKLPRDIGNFVLTIGATANQNGTALYEGVTVLFLAQFFGVELTLAQQVMVVFMSILAGVGTAGVPGGSLPMIAVVLQSVGVPSEGLCIILGVDRILDMCRTVLNVSGDLVIATCVARSEKPSPAIGEPESVPA